MRRRAVPSALLALVLATSACASTATGRDADASGAGGATWTETYDTDPWGDGLTRAVVRWNPDASPTSDDEGPDRLAPNLVAPDLGDIFEDVDPDHPLSGDPSAVPTPAPTAPDRLPPTTVPSPTTTPTDAVARTGTPDTAHPLLDRDGVVDVVPVADDLYEVVADLEVEEILALPGVQEGWPEIVAGISQDTRRAEQWYLDNDGSAVRGQPGVVDADTAAPDLWGRVDGNGIVVAVLDTGVDVSHPDLVDRIWVNSGETCGNGVDDDGNGYVDDCNGWDFTDGDGSIADTNGHGTHIAGTIAATADNGIGIAGVAPRAQIMPVRISTGPSFGLAVTVRAVDYAVANGADILNLSWGTRPGTPVNAYPPLADAIERARQAGVVVMIAAGNNGVNIDSRPIIPASYPHDNVVTVAASTNADQRASFSNWGPATVEVFAPGHHIMATMPGGGYDWMSGTSMATPVAAGVAALLKSVDPTAGYASIRDALLLGATEVPALASFTSTPGRVDAVDSASQLAPGISFGVTGLTEVRPDTPTTIGATPVIDPASGIDTSGTSVRATLVIDHQGAVRSVTDHEIVVDGATTTTDGAGRVEGSIRSNAPTMDLEVALPSGRYGLLLELVDASGTRVGEAGLAGFTVEPEVQAPVPTTTVPGDAPTTTTPPSTGGGGGTTPTPGITDPPSTGGGGGGSTPAPGGGSAPTVTTIPTTGGGGGGSTPAPTTTTPPSTGGGTTPGVTCHCPQTKECVARLPH
ncbi:MAG: S8 family peptidase [Actinomycetota bacterium]